MLDHIHTVYMRLSLIITVIIEKNISLRLKIKKLKKHDLFSIKRIEVIDNAECC